MKIKIITSCSFALLFLAASTSVFGIESANTTLHPQSKEIKKEVVQIHKTAAQEIKTIHQETKTETKNTKIQVRRQQISTEITKIRANLVSRYEHIVADKTALQNRINERKAKGLNTTTAETKLATFSTASYTNNLAIFDAQTAIAIASTKPYGQNTELKSTAKLLNTDLLNLRKILTETITSLVSGQKVLSH